MIAALDTPYRAFRKRKILLFEPVTKKGLLAKRDYRELARIFRCLLKTNALVNHFYEKAAKEYRERVQDITSSSAWKEYLRLKQDE